MGLLDKAKDAVSGAADTVTDTASDAAGDVGEAFSGDDDKSSGSSSSSSPSQSMGPGGNWGDGSSGSGGSSNSSSGSSSGGSSGSGGSSSGDTVTVNGIEYRQKPDGTLGERVNSPSDVSLDQIDDLQDTNTVSDGPSRGQESATDIAEKGTPQTGIQEITGGFSTDVTDDLTRGGFLSETPEGDSGLLPGEIAGVDISEDRFQGAAKWGEEQKAEFDKGGDFLGSPTAESALQGAAGVGVDVLNVPQHIQTVETTAEVAQNLPGAVDEHGAGKVGSTVAGVGAAVGESIVKDAKEDPVEFGSGAVFGYATGAAAGRAAGKTGRAVRDRLRTAGGSKVDAGDLANEDVLRYTETDGAEGDQFPGATDPDTYQSDPAEAVREQADDFTPGEVEDFFDEQGARTGRC